MRRMEIADTVHRWMMMMKAGAKHHDDDGLWVNGASVPS
jgi:hypothetical protein